MIFRRGITNIRDTRPVATPSGSYMPLGLPLYWELQLFAGVYTTTSATPTRIASRIINLASFPDTYNGLNREIKMHTIVESTGAGAVTLELVDVSLMVPQALTNATFGTSSTSPQYEVSPSAIPVGTAPGEIYLPGTHFYELQISVAAGAGTCSAAWLTVEYV